MMLQFNRYCVNRLQVMKGEISEKHLVVLHQRKKKILFC